MFPTIVPASVFGKNAPSNKINIGQIGFGRIGSSHDLPETLKNEVAPVSYTHLDVYKGQGVSSRVGSSKVAHSPKPDGAFGVGGWGRHKILIGVLDENLLRVTYPVKVFRIGWELGQRDAVLLSLIHI